jgi:fibro-slime domain-containing protein
VKEQLGPTRVPQPIDNPSESQANHKADRVDLWFTPWTPGDTLMLVHPPETTYTLDEEFNVVTEFIPGDTIYTDTLYKNIMIIDSLPFYSHGSEDSLSCRMRRLMPFVEESSDGTLDTTMAYTDVPDTFHLDVNPDRVRFSNSFIFPINEKGFGPDGFTGENTGINYGFTIQLHNSFIYNGGEELFVNGDDDIWVFIDNKLAIDIGGLHLASCACISLDSLGLTPGEQYSFDLFFAERHSSGSSLHIITDIVFAGEMPDTAITDSSTDSSNAESNTEESGDSGGFCGSGIGLAFIPLCAIRFRYYARRIRKTSRLR